jgi:hypothetical protein
LLIIFLNKHTGFIIRRRVNPALSATSLHYKKKSSQRHNLKISHSCRGLTAYSVCLKWICVILVNEITVHSHLLSTLSFRIKSFNFVEGANGTSLPTYLVPNILKESWNLVLLLLILFIENSYKFVRFNKYNVCRM